MNQHQYFYAFWGRAALLVAFCAALVLPATSDAFCVYNKTDRTILAYVSKGDASAGGFGKWIEPGDKACCNWKNEDCNKSGKRDAGLEFDLYFQKELDPLDDLKLIRREKGKSVCVHFPVKAGGWVTAKGKYPWAECKAHFNK